MFYTFLILIFSSLTSVNAKYEKTTPDDLKSYFGADLSSATTKQTLLVADGLEQKFQKLGISDHFIKTVSLAEFRKNFDDVLQISNLKNVNNLFILLRDLYFTYSIHSDDFDARRMSGQLEKLLDRILMGDWGLSNKQGLADHRKMITQYLMNRALHYLKNDKANQINDAFNLSNLHNRYKGKDEYIQHVNLINDVSQTAVMTYKNLGASVATALNHIPFTSNISKGKIKSEEFTRLIDENIKNGFKRAKDIKVNHYTKNTDILRQDFAVDLQSIYGDSYYKTPHDYRYHAMVMLINFYNKRKLLSDHFDRLKLSMSVNYKYDYNGNNVPDGYKITYNRGQIDNTVIALLNNDKGISGNFDGTTQLLEDYEYKDYIEAGIRETDIKYFGTESKNAFKAPKSDGYRTDPEIIVRTNYLIDHFKQNTHLINLQSYVIQQSELFIERFISQFISGYLTFKSLGMLKAFFDTINQSGCVNARLGNAIALESSFLVDEAKEFASQIVDKIIIPLQKDFTWKMVKDKFSEVYAIAKASGFITFDQEKMIKEYETYYKKIQFMDDNDKIEDEEIIVRSKKSYY